MKGKISGRVWISIILFGLFGQIAWTVENMYFNLFLYKTISGNPDYIAAMVAASAITATVTTLLMGVFSDRIGKRKVLICFGYIVWGITTASFAFISTENVKSAFHITNAVAATAILVIIMDCIMTFFGSTSNDSAFNAWVTDVTDKTNRGKAETVLEVMPLLALLIVFGGLDSLTQAGSWALSS
jgi:MFS family permease